MRRGEACLALHDAPARAGTAAGSRARSARRRATRRRARPRSRPRGPRPRRRPRAAGRRSRRRGAATSRRRRGRPTTRSARRCRSSRRGALRAGRGTSRAPSSPSSSGRASGAARLTARAARWARGRRRARIRSRRRDRRRACGTAASAARASRAVQPVHQRMSVSVAGPERGEPASEKLRLRLLAGSTLGIGPSSQASSRHPAVLAADPRSAGTAADDPALHRELRKDARPDALRRLEPRARRRSGDASPSTGTSFVRSDVNASPRSSSARSAAVMARVSHGCGPRRETAVLDHLLEPAALARGDRPRARGVRRSGTSSRGTTKSVRRMPSMRTSVRSS